MKKKVFFLINYLKTLLNYENIPFKSSAETNFFHYHDLLETYFFHQKKINNMISHILPFHTTFHMFLQSEKIWWNALVWGFSSTRIIFSSFFIFAFFGFHAQVHHFLTKFDTLGKCCITLDKNIFLESKTSYASAC